MPSLTVARYADPSGDAVETMRKAGRALGLPVTLVIDKDACEVAAVEGGAKWDSAEAQALVEALKGGRLIILTRHYGTPLRRLAEWAHAFAIGESGLIGDGLDRMLPAGSTAVLPE